jgi:transcriptional regulator with XRE-family HTH domain
VNTHNKAPFLRRRLGRRLRALREEAGLTIEQAAPLLDKTRSALGRIEKGVTRADVHFVRSCMDLYDQYVEDLIAETREALKPQWFRSFGVEDLGYVDVETYAAVVKEFPALNLPGLLQTEAYIRALFERDVLRRTRAELNNQISVRLIRQQRLVNDENPLELVAVVDEAALRREVGSAEIMRDQLRHLIEVAAWHTVTLQVLPLREGAHSAMTGSFILLSFPEPEDAELLYVEYATGALHIEDASELREARLLFGQLRTEALSPVDSVALIERILTEQYGS